jgi:SAM-dependent methyltransferase
MPGVTGRSSENMPAMASPAVSGPISTFAARARAAPHVIRFRLRRRRLAHRYLRGSGIEVGALHAPLTVPAGASVRYLDRMTVADLREHYPELAAAPLVPVDVVDDGETLGSQADASADFIVANHFIEHTEDPLGTLSNHLRVLLPGGILYMAVPDRRRTFDAQRPPTPLEHLVGDHRSGPAASRREHFEEWARLVEQVPADAVATRAQTLDEQDYSIHFHVWTASEFQRMLDYARSEEGLPFVVEQVRENEHEFIAILRRT